MPDFPSEAVIVLVFLLISFLSWLGEKVKMLRGGNQEDIPRPELRRPASPGQGERPPPDESPGASLRELLQSMGIPVDEPPPRPLSPPPLPTPQEETPPPRQRMENAVKKTVASMEGALTDAERAALEAIKKRRTPAVVARPPRSRASSQVRLMLQRENLQSAVILKEILDKPRCLRPHED